MIRLDTHIKKANETVRIERVMDHGQSTEDLWQMTPTHSDLNLTAEGLTGVTDTVICTKTALLLLHSACTDR